VLSLTDLKSDMSTGERGEGERDGKLGEAIIGVEQCEKEGPFFESLVRLECWLWMEL